MNMRTRPKSVQPLLELAELSGVKRRQLIDLTDPAWRPSFSPWRHGGWYVTNLPHPSGAAGCVSRNYPDGKWRIVCDPRPFETAPTFRTREAAALAERELVLQQWPDYMASLDRQRDTLRAQAQRAVAAMPLEERNALLQRYGSIIRGDSDAPLPDGVQRLLRSPLYPDAAGRWDLIVFESACTTPLDEPQDPVPSVATFTVYSAHKQVTLHVCPGQWLLQPQGTDVALALSRTFTENDGTPVAVLSDGDLPTALTPGQSLSFHDGRWRLRYKDQTRDAVLERTSKLNLWKRANDPNCTGATIVAALGL